MVQCEICGAELPKEIIPTSTTSSSSTETSAVNQIRLSFRKGGQSAFLAKLKGAVEGRQWEKV